MPLTFDQQVILLVIGAALGFLFAALGAVLQHMLESRRHKKRLKEQTDLLEKQLTHQSELADRQIANQREIYEKKLEDQRKAFLEQIEYQKNLETIEKHREQLTENEDPAVLMASMQGLRGAVPEHILRTVLGASIGAAILPLLEDEADDQNESKD